MERRWYHRSETDLTAKLFVSGDPRPIPCRIKNFGAGGLFVETSFPLAPHQFVQVHIDRDGASPHVTRGMVVHCTSGGAGIDAEIRFRLPDAGSG
jgi:hypothetical protein